MVILAIVFLILTRWQCHRWDIPSWQSSALATMMHGVGHPEGGGSVVAQEAEIGGDGKEKISDLEEWAEKLEVRLRRKGTKEVAYGLVRC
jgi:hypothetical protein